MTSGNHPFPPPSPVLPSQQYASYEETTDESRDAARDGVRRAGARRRGEARDDERGVKRNPLDTTTGDSNERERERQTPKESAL